MYHFPLFFTDCILYAVGKPVFHRYTPNVTYGCWMRDPDPPNSADEKKIYVTVDKEKNKLFEFDNKAAFSNKNQSPQ